MIKVRDLFTALVLHLKNPNMSSRDVMNHLKGAQHPWYIWVCINLKPQMQVKLHPKNISCVNT